MSYSKCLRRTQIKWVIWRSSRDCGPQKPSNSKESSEDFPKVFWTSRALCSLNEGFLLEFTSRGAPEGRQKLGKTEFLEYLYWPQLKNCGFRELNMKILEKKIGQRIVLCQKILQKIEGVSFLVFHSVWGIHWNLGRLFSSGGYRKFAQLVCVCVCVCVCAPLCCKACAVHPYLWHGWRGMGDRGARGSRFKQIWGAWRKCWFAGWLWTS